MQGVGQEIVELLGPVLGSDRAADFASSFEYDDIVDVTDMRFFASEVAQREMREKGFSLCEIGRIVEVCVDMKERYDAVSYIYTSPLSHINLLRCLIPSYLGTAR